MVDQERLNFSEKQICDSIFPQQQVKMIDFGFATIFASDKLWGYHGCCEGAALGDTAQALGSISRSTLEASTNSDRNG